MNLSTAFGITEEDIANVLRQNAVHVANSNGMSFAAMSEQLYNDWTNVELARVAKAALNGGVEMDQQTTAAHGEIRAILVEQGVLKR
ncbi:hypothetical protein [Burkholderia ubonensis]|uniref:hypothetical protein n=1 Tax=Burkholderia ubonensis TaxID=101571 RepID=UPI000754CE10|nr:hypothetical protein [Burkholderia ubonensis]KVP39965.1 hypothetical protein WJ87_07210 [Burkholderia ubonensis]